MSNSAPPEETENCPELGVLLFPSFADAKYHMGHMWVNWKRVGVTEVPSRGYRPDISRVPKEFRSPDKYRDFFIRDSVPGQMVDEAFQPGTIAALNQHRPRVHERWWRIDNHGLAWLEFECFIPRGQYFVDKGKYSCDENRDDCDNCSSWALRVVRGAMRNPSFLACARPKRLSHVQRAIWGNTMI
jgi:hypothetical protein